MASPLWVQSPSGIKNVLFGSVYSLKKVFAKYRFCFQIVKQLEMLLDLLLEVQATGHIPIPETRKFLHGPVPRGVAKLEPPGPGASVPTEPPIPAGTKSCGVS
jgi:hypothetical protein